MSDIQAVHRLVDRHRGICACGERARLGTSVPRWWDRHLVAEGVEAVTVPLAALREVVAAARAGADIADSLISNTLSAVPRVNRAIEALGVEGL